jgi:hypothetical protein
MAEFDHGVKQITDTKARELARVARVECGRLEPLESTLPATTELLADRAFRARNGREPFVLYFEFYTRWAKNAPWDMLGKSGLLSQREHLPTVSLAFVLQPRGCRSRGGQFRLEAAGGPTQQLRFREVCLWEVEPEPWWDAVPGLMALYPLCRHRRNPSEAVRHAAQAIEQTLSAPGDREDQLFLLSIFGALAYPRLDVERIIGSAAVIGESRIVKRIRREGLLEARQADLLIVLAGRFGDDVAAQLAPLVNSVDDPQLLENLLKQVVAGGSLAAFRTAVRSQHS